MNKKLHAIYLPIIGILFVVGIVSFFVGRSKYEKDLAADRQAYEAAKKQYEDALVEISSKESDWKTVLENKQSEVNDAYEELSSIYQERQDAEDKEAHRIELLSDEEREAESRAMAYNEMVSELRTSNEEYAKLYVEYSKYLGEDVFNLGKEEALEYVTLYERLTEIEQDYWNK